MITIYRNVNGITSDGLNYCISCEVIVLHAYCKNAILLRQGSKLEQVVTNWLYPM